MLLSLPRKPVGTVGAGPGPLPVPRATFPPRPWRHRHEGRSTVPGRAGMARLAPARPALPTALSLAPLQILSIRATKRAPGILLPQCLVPRCVNLDQGSLVPLGTAICRTSAGRYQVYGGRHWAAGAGAQKSWGSRRTGCPRQRSLGGDYSAAR